MTSIWHPWQGYKYSHVTGIHVYNRSGKRIIDNCALRQTTNAIMLLPCNEWTEQLLNIIISSCSKSEVGMAKNSGFAWTVVWNGGQNVVFRNIRIRVVGAWIGKPGEKLLLLRYRASPISLPMTSVGLCRRVMAAFHHVFAYTCALGGEHTEHPSGLEWTIMWR